MIQMEWQSYGQSIVVDGKQHVFPDKRELTHVMIHLAAYTIHLPIEVLVTLIKSNLKNF